MSDFQKALKAEIIRLSRREIKRAIAPLKSATTKARSAIAGLKAALAKQAAAPAEAHIPGVSDKEVKAARFSGKLVRKLRIRLGLAQAVFGKLIGVSSLTILDWEKGHRKIGAKHRKALVALRKTSKRDIKQMVNDGRTIVG
jgi:DNA-binding transcriptional regulator YiaG